MPDTATASFGAMAKIQDFLFGDSGDIGTARVSFLQGDSALCNHGCGGVGVRAVALMLVAAAVLLSAGLVVVVFGDDCGVLAGDGGDERDCCLVPGTCRDVSCVSMPTRRIAFKTELHRPLHMSNTRIADAYHKHTALEAMGRIPVSVRFNGHVRVRS